MEAIFHKWTDFHKSNSSGDTLFHQAIREDNHGLLRVLCKYVPNPNAPNADGCTPLQLAAYQGKQNLVGELLSWTPIQVDISNTCDGCTALHYATQQGHEDVAKLLVDHGADPKKLNKAKDLAKGKYPLQKDKTSQQATYIPTLPANRSKNIYLYLAILGIALMAIGLRNKIWQGFKPTHSKILTH